MLTLLLHVHWPNAHIYMYAECKAALLAQFICDDFTRISRNVVSRKELWLKNIVILNLQVKQTKQQDVHQLHMWQHRKMQNSLVRGHLCMCCSTMCSSKVLMFSFLMKSISSSTPVCSNLWSANCIVSQAAMYAFKMTQHWGYLLTINSLSSHLTVAAD